jgi:hypothetical protein
VEVRDPFAPGPGGETPDEIKSLDDFVHEALVVRQPTTDHERRTP